MTALNKVFSSIGDSRAEHVANIAMAQSAWASYEGIHAGIFAENNLQKYVVVNAAGQIIARDSDKAKLLTNADGTLRHEDFMTIRDRIVEVRRRSLSGIADLMAAGLTFNEDIGTQLAGFENVNEFQEAEQEMNPNKYQGNDTVFTASYVPLPITHQSFQIPWRQTGFDYKRSMGMTESIRQVAERLEKTLFLGNAGIVVNFNGTNFPIYGYTTHPSRGTDTISNWAAVANIDAIIPELIEQIGLMWSAQGGVSNKRVMVYVANDIWMNLQNDYTSAAPSKSVYDRAKEVAQVMDVKPSEKLANGDVVLVEMESRTVELAVASDIITVPHTKTNPMAPQVLTTYAAMVQQIKVDSSGKTGVRHLSK